MKQAYIDSSVWIARVEGFPAYRSLVSQHMRDLREKDWQFCISEAVSLEVLAKPHQERRQDLILAYQKLFHRIISLSTVDDIFQKALYISEGDRLKGMDAIHVAFAVEYDCQLFITTDPHFRTLKSLPLHMIDLSQAAPS